MQPLTSPTVISPVSGRVLDDVDLERADFTGADLRGFTFRRARLRGASFVAADLRAAVFIDCDLREARFAGAILGANEFRGSQLAGATGLTADQQSLVEGCGGLFVEWAGWTTPEPTD